MDLVVDGKPRATVLIPKDASRRLREAADDLVRIVERASGAKLPLVEDSGVPVEGNLLMLGPTAEIPMTNEEGKPLPPDGFRPTASTRCSPTRWGFGGSFRAR